jgi:hypothetical protein
MARSSNDSETLIPVDAIVAQSGLSGEWVWSRLNKSEVELDWDDGVSMRWSVAKRVA